MSRLVSLMVLSAGTLAACDPDCGDQARLDGTWEVSQNVVDAAAISGDNLSAYPDDMPVFNGASTWTMKWVPGNSSFQVNIDDRPFTATYTESAESCNTFALEFSGSFESEVGSVHELAWTGDVTWYGEEMAGTFSYADTWTNPETGTSGSINVPAGEFYAGAVTASN